MATPPSLPAVLNLRRFSLLRAAAIAGWIFAAAFAFWQLRLALPFAAIAAVILAWTFIAAWSWTRLRRRSEISDRVFFGQLLIDVGALGALLYMTGGATNPLTLLLLLPLIISAALLPGRYSWAIALAVMACYTLLLYAYVPLPFLEHAGANEFGLHVIGMWSGFVASAGLIASFVARMGSTLRERDRILADAKQRALRDERIVALGTLAAGAAHELGTPLGTIALLAETLEQERAAPDAEFGETIRLLKAQVARCKQTLAMLSMSAGQSQAAAGRRLALDRYLDETVQQWRVLRPAVELAVDIRGKEPAPVILAEQTLTQALFSLFNNAADAAPAVDIVARWDADQLALQVKDRGEGVTPEAASAAGSSVFSTKGPHEGLGLGLYLAYSIINRLGGSVRLFNRAGGGACTEVLLPLDRLAVAAAAGGPAEGAIAYASRTTAAG
jgi:two-component system sensor histidine kinase RegB